MGTNIDLKLDSPAPKNIATMKMLMILRFWVKAIVNSHFAWSVDLGALSVYVITVVRVVCCDECRCSKRRDKKIQFG